MPSYEQHCRESMEMFGQAFGEVHLWLDEFAGNPPYGMRHRKLRHHEAGIRDVARLFGLQAAEAARRHIISDLTQEGWSEADPFPRDHAHYVSLGLF